MTISFQGGAGCLPATSTRRGLFAGALAATLAPAARAGAPAEASRLLAVIDELEGAPMWYSSLTYTAQHYAAFRMRLALGLPLPDPEHARAHLDMLRSKFEDYQRTVYFDRDMAAGKVIVPPPGADKLLGV